MNNVYYTGCQRYFRNIFKASLTLVNEAPHNKAEDLVKKIQEVMGSLDKDTVAKACSRFRSRMETVVAADGDFMD